MNQCMHMPQFSALDPLMYSLFKGNTVQNETVMFLDRTDVKPLLYPIEQVISVTSYDQTVTYEAGKDYTVADGNLVLPEGSSIPCITREAYYNVPESILQTEYNGKNVLTHWGSYDPMNRWQINVTYTHAASWDGFVQPDESAYFARFLEKLKKGEDVTVFFYGDSITHGFDTSWMNDSGVRQYPYTILFTRALAELYGYTVRYQPSGITEPPIPQKLPETDYAAGTRGTITYINTAIGGWTSLHAIDRFDDYVKKQIERYGCDLFVIAFGMNDGGWLPEVTNENITKVVDGVLEICPAASVVLLSTMVPNPKATNGWYGYQEKQEPVLLKQAEAYRAAGVPCGVCRMTSLSLSILTRKDFYDYSGNNINHPNDFFGRVYAQTLLQTVVGYHVIG